MSETYKRPAGTFEELDVDSKDADAGWRLRDLPGRPADVLPLTRSAKAGDCAPT